MKRNLRVVLLLLAAVLHIGAPVVAYAVAQPVAVPSDFCSAARGAPASPSDRGSSRHSSELHCAHAPCCAGGTLDSTALPPHLPSFHRIAQAGVRAPESTPVVAPVAVILAAQPRGPPVLP
jgi:hypothetical protein